MQLIFLSYKLTEEPLETKYEDDDEVTNNLSHQAFMSCVTSMEDLSKIGRREHASAISADEDSRSTMTEIAPATVSNSIERLNGFR